MNDHHGPVFQRFDETIADDEKQGAGTEQKTIKAKVYPVVQRAQFF